MKHLSFVIIFVFATVITVGQNFIIKGKVLDAVTGEPLPFVNILTEDKEAGTMSDIDGLFTLKLNDKICCITISHVGYEIINYKIDYNRKTQLVLLTPKSIELDEVEVFPGENPAHRIIKNAVANIKKNNPENLPEFSYLTYDKLHLTVDVPGLMGKDIKDLDSTEIRAKKFLEKQDFFLMETVTKRYFKKPGLNQEKVLSTRISGFKDPVMIFLLSELQSASFYEPEIIIAGDKYVNPVSKGSVKKYFFQLKDTLYNSNSDTTFVIFYRPLLNKKFDGMKGLLYINSNGWAIQYVKAQPVKDTSEMQVTIQQSYNKIDSVWFPFQLKTEIILKKSTVRIGDTNYPIVAKGTSYIKDLNLHPGLRRRDFGLYEVEVAPDASSKKDDFWNKYRNEPLTEREKETYRTIDSLGEASHLDSKMAFLQSVITGKIPIGPVSVDMDKIFRYNVYEGFYLGMGIHTNRKFSEKLKLGGFAGYGFGDKKWKYGGDVSFMFHKATESIISAEYYFMPLESGGVRYFSEKHREWNPENYGDFFVERKNLTKSVEIDYSFRLRSLRYFKWNIGFAVQKKQSFGKYKYKPLDINGVPEYYNFTKLIFEFRFAFREKIIHTGKETISAGSDYPVVFFKFIRGFKGVADGEFKYSSFNLRIKGKVETKYTGSFLWNLNLGYISGDIPETDLFSIRGTYRTFTLYAPGTFGTMIPNEFLSDKYASLFMTWDFKDLLFSVGNWKPRLLFLTNIAVGSLKTPGDHLNYDFKTMEKGYFESGLVVRKLIDLKIVDIGGGVMYRYGPYSFDKMADNFAYKISLYYGL